MPLNIPSVEEGSLVSTDLTRRIDTFCKEQKERRRQEQESHRQTLDALRQSKDKQLKQHDQEER